MNLRQLQAFKAVLETGSVTQAAERLHVTQPAVSALLANLEADIGFSLFARRKGRVQATPEAQRFYEEVEQLLSTAEKTTRVAQAIRDMQAGVLRIACLPGLSLGFLPRLVAQFLKEHRDVQVQLHSRSSIQIKEWLGAQLMDIGLAELPIDLPSVTAEIIRTRCVCVLSEGHPLSQNSVIGPEDLGGYPFISLLSDHMTHFRLRQAFEDAGVPWAPQVESQLFMPASVIVESGFGISVIDPFTAQEIRGRRIVVRPFEPQISFNFGILYPSERPRSLLVEAFSDLLHRELAPYLAV